MWAVSETDMTAISIAGTAANISYALGSFFLGFAVNIFVAYSGSEKLTEVGSFMLNKGTWLLIGLAVAFYIAGIVMTKKKGSLWNTIKSESKQISR